MSTVFVAGATGVIGRRAVRLLVDAGHAVTGVARSDGKEAMLRSIGATPVRVDVFDAAAVKDAVVGHDVVINLTTHIPRATTSAALPGAWKTNDRIRREVSANLVDAALAAGATRYVQESITFGYADAGTDWIAEDAPYEPASYPAAGAAEANTARFTESGGAGIVLRFGMFYDAESHTTRDLIRAATLGRLALPGRGDAYASFVATDDAARAVVAALDAPAGTYNVVDDEPMTRAEIARVLSTALGRPVAILPSVASTAARAGRQTEPLARSQRVSNLALKAASGWAPAASSLRSGLPPVAHEIAASAPSRGVVLPRVLLALLLPATFASGVWAAISPRSFYDNFPGLGLAWVTGDGPFNEHLVRDFGSLNLALAIVLGVAVWKGGRVLVTTAAASYLAFAVPHLVYHLRHSGVLAGFDRSSSQASLTAAVLLAAGALVIAARRHGSVGGSTDAI